MLDVQTSPVVASLADALENMAFVGIAPAEDFTPPTDAILLRIEFVRPTPGYIELLCPRQLGALIASNLLGVDPGDAECAQASPDVLKELLNVTCGSMLHAVQHGVVEPFQMGLPSAKSVDAESIWGEFTDGPEAVVLNADGFNIGVRSAGAES